MDLSGKSVLMIVAPENFRDEEYFEPKTVLTAYGATVITASTLREAKSKTGQRIKTDIQLGEITDSTHDAIVFVGGSGAEIYLSMVKVHKIARAYLESGKVVAAICIAPAILANAGLLEGIKATAFEDQLKVLRKHNAVVTESPVVQDGNIITADGPAAAKKFGETIARALTE